MQEAFVVDDFETMKALIVSGVDVNSIDSRDGSTVLQRAVIQNEIGVVDFLIENHVDLNKTDLREMTALHYAAIYKFNDIAKHLIGAGAIVDAKDKNGCTALAYAISNRSEGYLEMAKLLVGSGADTDLKTKEGQSLFELFGVSLKDMI